jgi:hypothetical protein
MMAATLPIGSAVIGSQAAGATARPHTASTVIYDSTSTPVVAVPSLGFEATQGTEAGNQVSFSNSSPRYLTTVSVTMDSWGCQSGTWSVSGSCTTTPGSTFNEPITLNLYNVGAGNSVGSKFASITHTFAIPFRPSSDLANCPDGQTFFQNGQCVHGLANNVTFTVPNLLVPNSLIWSVAYNTSDYGSAPYGDATACHSTSAGCGYDSLNVGLTVASGPSVGTDPLPGTIYWNTGYGPFYCDGGAGGHGTFRLDAGPPVCWGDQSPYNTAPWDIPAAQFVAVAAKPSAPIGPTGVPGNGSVTVSWSPPASNGTGTITAYNVTASPGGATCSTGGATTCTVSGLTNGTPYRFTVTATNSAGTGPGATTAAAYIPATSGFHVYASPPVVEQKTPVTISATGATASSSLTLTVVGRASATVTTDAFGAGYHSFTIQNFGKFRIKAVDGAAQATGTLYVAIVYTPTSVRHGNQVNVGVTSAIPGSTIHVTTNRGGNYFVPVPSTGHVAVHIPGTFAGNLRITVTDNGFPLVVRNVPIT